MAKTPEALVKEKIRDVLDELGIYYTQTVSGGFGKNGPLDFSCCAGPAGRYVGIEAKSTRTAYGRRGMTELQKEHFKRILDTGGVALVINEDNLDTLKGTLECLTKKK